MGLVAALVLLAGGGSALADTIDAAVPVAPFWGNDYRVGLAVDSDDPARKGLLAWVYEYSYWGWIYRYTYCRTMAADGSLGSTYYLGGGDAVRSPSVAFSSGSGRYAVAFKSGSAIYVTVRSQDGAQISAPVQVASSGDLPQVVWRQSGDEFIVLYTQTISSSNYRVYAWRVSNAGTLIGKSPTQLASLYFTGVVPQSLAAAYRPTGDQLLVATSWSDSYFWNFNQAYYQHRSASLTSFIGGFYAFAVENELSLTYNPTADRYWKTSRPSAPASQISVSKIAPGATWFETTVTAATTGTVTEPSVAFAGGLSEGVVAYTRTSGGTAYRTLRYLSSGLGWVGGEVPIAAASSSLMADGAVAAGGTTIWDAFTIDTGYGDFDVYAQRVGDSAIPFSPAIESPPDGAVTNDSTPFFGGGGEPNAAVDVYRAGNVWLGGGTADAFGAFTISSASIPEGVHSITATQTDLSGQISAASAPITLTIDTIAPAAPLITSPLPGTLTNDAVVTVLGTAEANSTVQVYRAGSVLVGSSIADGTGSFLVVTSPLPDGEHTLSATAEDAAGNISAPSGEVPIAIDTVPPAVPVITSPPSGFTTSTPVISVAGIAEAYSMVEIYDSGSVLVATTVATAGGTFATDTAPLAVGEHALWATAEDAASNISPPSPPIPLLVVTPTCDVTIGGAQSFTVGRLDTMTFHSPIAGDYFVTSQAIPGEPFCDPYLDPGVAPDNRSFSGGPIVGAFPIKVTCQRSGKATVHFTWTDPTGFGCSTSVVITAIDQTLSFPMPARNRRVDVHGVPQPDPSPLGEGEKDRLPGMAYVDMFSLAPTLSTSDVSIPLEGGELFISLRRTLGIRSDTDPKSGTESPTTGQYASETMLGPGWDCNLGARIVVREIQSAFGSLTTATVVDEQGSSSQYIFEPLMGWLPDVYHSFSNDALRGRMATIDPDTLELTRVHGTKLIYKKIPSAGYSFGATNLAEIYFRLETVTDRNGNQIVYTYPAPTQPPDARELLPSSVYEAAHPERALALVYQDFGSNLRGDRGWRLISATDPLGRTWDYTYDASTSTPHYALLEVQGPAVLNGESGLSERPTSHFTYRIFELEPWAFTAQGGTVFSNNKVVFTCPATLENPRGHTTSFEYLTELFPTAIPVGPSGAAFSEKPRVLTMVSDDGTAFFYTLERTHTAVHTKVADTAGTEVEYEFGSDVTSAAEKWAGLPSAYVDLPFGGAIVIDHLTRTTLTGAGPHSATFRWATNTAANLIEVTDLSGQVTTFFYGSGDPGDPYDQPMDPSQPYQPFTNPNHYEVFNQPAERVVAVGELDLTSSYRYETTFNKLISSTDPAGRTTSFVVDPLSGNRTALTDALGNQTLFAYELDGFLATTTDPLGRVTESARTFDPADLAAYQTIKRTVVGFPAAPLNLTAESVVDVLGATRSSTDGEGNVTTFDLDALSRVTVVHHPPVEDPNNPGGPFVSAQTSREYTLHGQVTKTTNENGDVTITTYDSMDRVISTRRRMASPLANDPSDLVTSVTYNAVGLPETQTDANGHTVSLLYDELLRLVQKTLPTVTTPSGPQTYQELFFYDGPNAGAGAFVYVGGWKPTRAVNARGFATDVAFDAAHRSVQTVRRLDDGASVASDAAHRPGEPASFTTYNAASQPVVVTVLSEDGAGQSADRSTYTFYDNDGRPTVKVTDLDGDGAGVPPGTPVDDASLFGGDPDDLIARVTYDYAGQPTLEQDPAGRVTEHIFDGAGREVETRLPPVTVYDPSGYNPNGLQAPITHTAYDARGLKVQVEDPNHTVTQTTYDSRGRFLVVVVDLNGDGVFDASFNGPDIVSETHYDLAGRAIRAVDSRGNDSFTAYDRAGRAVEAQGPPVFDAESGITQRPVVVTVYDPNGNVVSSFDPRGVEGRTVYDELNRPVQSTSAFGTPDAVTTDTVYDESGNQTALTLHNGPEAQTTTRVYDAFDRLLSETPPDVGDGYSRTVTYSYIPSGEVSASTDAKGQPTTKKYDRAGRVTSVILKRADQTTEETRTFIYDAASNPTQIDDGQGMSIFTYDALNQILTEQRIFVGGASGASYVVQSDYDAAGLRTAITYPDTGRNLVSLYDRAGRLVQIDDFGAGPPSTFTWDVNGSRTLCSTPNGVTTSYTYDAANRVTASTASGAQGLIYQATYTYDLAGNKRLDDETVTGIGSRSVTYSYDAQYRLTGEDWGAGSVGYAHDAAGNRLTQTAVTASSTVVTSYVYDKLNRLLSASTKASLVTYTYDLNGARLTKTAGGATDLHTWDVAGRLVAVDLASNGSLDFQASYDYRTRRLTTVEPGVTKAFRYDGSNSFQEVYPAGPVRVELIRGTGLGGGIGSVLYTEGSHVTGGRESFTYNPVGHTVATVDWNGAVQSTQIYEAFGGLRQTAGFSENNRLANTKERSSVLGLDNHGFRYYDPEIGRYLSRDPAGFVDGLNVYLYVRGNPINGVDPLGLEGASPFPGFDQRQLPDGNRIDERWGPVYRADDRGAAGFVYVGAAATEREAIFIVATVELERRRGIYQLEQTPGLAEDRARLARLPGAVADIASMLTPGVNDVRDFQEATTGFSVFEQRSLVWWERALSAGGLILGSGAAARKALSEVGIVGRAAKKARVAGKPSLRAHKRALREVHGEVGKLPKGKPGKFGSPQAGSPKKGYRLGPPHAKAKPRSPESKTHLNWWDYTKGKRGKGGRSGAIPVED